MPNRKHFTVFFKSVGHLVPRRYCWYGRYISGDYCLYSLWVYHFRPLYIGFTFPLRGNGEPISGQKHGSCTLSWEISRPFFNKGRFTFPWETIRQIAHFRLETSVQIFGYLDIWILILKFVPIWFRIWIRTFSHNFFISNLKINVKTID